MPSSSWHATTTLTKGVRSSAGKGKLSKNRSKDMGVVREKEPLSEDGVISEEEVEDYSDGDGDEFAHDDDMMGRMHQSFNDHKGRRGGGDKDLPDLVSPGRYGDAPTSVSQKGAPTSAPSSASRILKKGVGKVVGSLTKKIASLPLDMTISSSGGKDFSALDDDDDTFAADAIQESPHHASDDEMKPSYLGQWMASGSNHVVDDDSVDFSVEDSYHEHMDDSVGRSESESESEIGLNDTEEPEKGDFPGRNGSGSLSSLQSITDEETVEDDDGGHEVLHQNSGEQSLGDNQEQPRRRSSGRKRGEKSEARPRVRQQNNAKRERKTSRRQREHRLQASKAMNSSKQSVGDENLSDDEKDADSNASFNDSNNNSLDLSSMSSSSRRTSQDEEQGSVGSYVSSKSASHGLMSTSARSLRSRQARQEQRQRLRRKIAPVSSSALDITNPNSDSESSGSIQFEEGNPMGPMPMSLPVDPPPTDDSTDMETGEGETVGIQLALDGLIADPLANKGKKSTAGKAFKKMKKIMGGMGLRQPSEDTIPSVNNYYPEALALQPLELGSSIPELAQNGLEEDTHWPGEHESPPTKLDPFLHSAESMPSLESLGDRQLSDGMPTLVSAARDEDEKARGRHRAGRQKQTFPGLAAGLVVDNAAGVAATELLREKSSTSLLDKGKAEQEWKRDSSSKSVPAARNRERSVVRDRNLARQKSLTRQNSRKSVSGDKSEDSGMADRDDDSTMMTDASKARRSRSISKRNVRKDPDGLSNSGDKDEEPAMTDISRARRANSRRTLRKDERGTSSRSVATDLDGLSSSRDKDEDPAMTDVSKARRANSRRTLRKDERGTSSVATDLDGLSSSRDKDEDPAMTDISKARRANSRRTLKKNDRRPSSRSVATEPGSIASNRDKDEDSTMNDSPKGKRQTATRRNTRKDEKRTSSHSVATEGDGNGGGELPKNSSRNGERRSRRPRGSDPPASRTNRDTSPTAKDGQRSRRPKAADPPAERRRRSSVRRRNTTTQPRRAAARGEHDDVVAEPLPVTRMQSTSVVSQLKW